MPGATSTDDVAIAPSTVAPPQNGNRRFNVRFPPIADVKPNLTATASYDLVASRDIELGEELTVLYSSLNSAAG